MSEQIEVLPTNHEIVILKPDPVETLVAVAARVAAASAFFRSAQSDKAALEIHAAKKVLEKYERTLLRSKTIVMGQESILSDEFVKELGKPLDGSENTP